MFVIYQLELLPVTVEYPPAGKIVRQMVARVVHHLRKMLDQAVEKTIRRWMM